MSKLLEPKSTVAVATQQSAVEKLLYTKEEVYAALGIGETTLWRWEKRGILSSIPGIQRKKLYRATDVRRVAEKGAVTS